MDEKFSWYCFSLPASPVYKRQQEALRKIHAPARYFHIISLQERALILLSLKFSPEAKDNNAHEGALRSVFFGD